MVQVHCGYYLPEASNCWYSGIHKLCFEMVSWKYASWIWKPYLLLFVSNLDRQENVSTGSYCFSCTLNYRLQILQVSFWPSHALINWSFLHFGCHFCSLWWISLLHKDVLKKTHSCQQRHTFKSSYVDGTTNDLKQSTMCLHYSSSSSYMNYLFAFGVVLH